MPESPEATVFVVRNNLGQTTVPSLDFIISRLKHNNRWNGGPRPPLRGGSDQRYKVVWLNLTVISLQMRFKDDTSGNPKISSKGRAHAESRAGRLTTFVTLTS